MLSILLLTGFFGLASANPVEVSDQGHAYNPHWSPDGKYLAFELNRYGDAVDLYVVEVKNGNGLVPVKLVIPGVSSSFSARGSVVAHPVWHPQGTVIFEGSNAGGTQRLYYWAPGGQTAAELLPVGQISGDLTWPTITPDGSKVAFVSDSTGNGDIYLWEQSTNNITSTFTSQFTEASPKFSPDSNSTLAFTRKNQGTEDLYLFENNEPKPLKGGNGDQTRPVWVGDKIVYFTNERGEGHWDIAITDKSGNRKVLAREVRLPMRTGPAITPDGQSVVYTMSDPEEADKLMVSKLDGSKTVEIPTGLVACGEPDLIQQGSKIFAAFTALLPQQSDYRSLHIIDVTGKLP